jgi:hypothetical protein
MIFRLDSDLIPVPSLKKRRELEAEQRPRRPLETCGYFPAGVTAEFAPQTAEVCRNRRRVDFDLIPAFVWKTTPAGRPSPSCRRHPFGTWEEKEKKRSEERWQSHPRPFS